MEWNKWQSWSDDVIRKQFVRDLANPDLSKIDELNWVFKKTDGITDMATLKSKVINALKGDLSKIEDAFDEDMVRKLFPTDLNDIVFCSITYLAGDSQTLRTVNGVVDVVERAIFFKLNPDIVGASNVIVQSIEVYEDIY